MSEPTDTAPLRDTTVEQAADAMTEGLVRSIHPEKVFDFLPGMTTPTLAALYGLDEHTYRSLREHFAGQVDRAAGELLADDGVAAALDALPFADGTTIAVIGESSTDAADSWWEILTRLLCRHPGGCGLTLQNAAISGHPTTMNHRILVGVLARHRPDWVIFGVGGNDTLRYGTTASKPMVSIAETTRNLAEMRRAAAAAGARVIWITLSAFDLDRAAAYPPLRAQGIWADHADVDAVSDAVRHQARTTGDLLIDLTGCFGNPPDPEYLQADGLHPTLAGQQAIAQAFVEQVCRRE